MAEIPAPAALQCDLLLQLVPGMKGSRAGWERQLFSLGLEYQFIRGRDHHESGNGEEGMIGKAMAEETPLPLLLWAGRCPSEAVPQR